MDKVLRTVLLFSFIAFLSPCSLSSAESSSTQPANIFQILEKIESINQEINQTAAALEDKKDFDSGRDNLTRLINQKITIIEGIPEKILKGEIYSSFQEARFKADVQKLENRIETNSRLGNHTAVIRDEVRIDYLKLNKKIDACCKDIKKLLHKPGEEEKLLELFKAKLRELADLDISRYEAALDTASQSEIHRELQDTLNRLKARRNSFREILSFFSENTMLLMPEVFTYGSISLQKVLNRINGLTSFRPLGINPGKMVISTGLLILSLLLYMGVIRLLESLLRKYLVPEESETEDEDDVLKSIRKPVAVLLLLYIAENIIRIIFYPAAISPHLVLLFDLLKLAVWIWTAFILVRIYGEVSASNLLKRKDTLRREIIGLGIKISYFIIVVIAVIIALRRMDYDISAVLASLGIGGLAMALAARDTLANFLASVTILITNPFSLGDWIETEAAEGTVVEVGLRQTTIRTFDNSMLFVPNALLSDKIIRNWSRRKLGRRIKTLVSLPNESDVQSLKRCVTEIRKMLTEHPEIANPHRSLFFSNQNWLKSRKNIVSPNDLYGYKNDLMVYVDSLGSSTIDILIYCFSRTTDWDKWLAVKEDILLKIIEIIRDNGLELAVPAQNIHLEAISGREQLPGSEQVDEVKDHELQEINEYKTGTK